MKHKEEIVLALKGGTLELFNLWQELEPEINRVAEKLNVKITSIVYDQEKMTKSCNVYFDSKLHFVQAILKLQQLSVPKGIFTEVVSRKIIPCDCDSLNLISQYKIKYKH